MVKGYTDHIAAICSTVEKQAGESLNGSAVPGADMSDAMNALCGDAMACLSAMYIIYRSALGFNPTSAEMRVRWAMELYLRAVLDGTKANLADTFVPTTLDTVDAIIDEAAANDPAAS